MNISDLLRKFQEEGSLSRFLGIEFLRREGGEAVTASSTIGISRIAEDGAAERISITELQLLDCGHVGKAAAVCMHCRATLCEKDAEACGVCGRIHCAACLSPNLFNPRVWRCPGCRPFGLLLRRRRP